MRYTALHHQVRAARRQKALSQAALAARSGTSRVTIARLEAGSGQDFRVGTISRRLSHEPAEAMVIHEMLHTLGLGENPPSTFEITDRVRERCR